MSAPAEAAGATQDTPRKGTVLQATIGVLGLIALVVVLGITMSRQAAVLQQPAAPTAPGPGSRQSAADFREMAERDAADVRALRPEGELAGNRAVPPPVESEAESAATLASILDSLNERGAAPPAPLPADARGPANRAVDDDAASGFTPLFDAAAEGGNNTPTAAPTDATGGTSLPPGSLIEGAISQQVSSDFAGSPWVGLVSRPVYLPDGRIAVPAGSKIIGVTKQHDGPNAVLQGRVPLDARSIVRPDGSTIALNSQVLDATGIAAIPGATNRHVLAQAGGVLAYALIGAATAGSGSSAPLSTDSQFQQDAAQGAGQQATPWAQRYLQVQNTVTVRQGTPLRLLLSEPLSVTPYDGA